MCFPQSPQTGASRCAAIDQEPRQSSAHLPRSGFIGFTWTPKVCKIMAFMAIIMGLGQLFYILLGFRV